MKLNRVTFTGVDDETDINELVALQSVFPFVEWGVLIGSGFGSRFPGYKTFHRLREAWASTNCGISLALHLCGKHLRLIVEHGEFPYLHDTDDTLPSIFNRMQLNFHGEPLGTDRPAENILAAFKSLASSPYVIFQMDGVNDHLFNECKSQLRADALFDLSHGAGISPDRWQKNFADEYCGYAGGLGPHNLRDQLNRISEVVDDQTPIWIDMETHVRTGEVFDLKKVRACCEIASEFIH